MAFRDRDSMCIICREREGTIATEGGPVCAECMPAELVPTASSLSRSRLLIYRKTRPGWVSWADATKEGPVREEALDRSMAIAQGEPIMLADALNRAISSASEIDVVVSFVRMSGLNLIIDGLREAAESGCRIRAITTAYMGATEGDAVIELADLPGAEVRMELDSERTRLHAKSFLFSSPDGKGTAFVGSANLSQRALTSGAEWVAVIREEDLPMVLRDLRSAYDKLWSSPYLTRVGRWNRADIEMALERRGM